jgi:hypothetical protein
MVECNKQSGPVGIMPFKLKMPQLATSFVAFAAAIGHDAPATGHSMRPPLDPSLRYVASSHPGRSSFLLLAPPTPSVMTGLTLLSASYQIKSFAVCLGCQQPGHTFEQCNRFVGYIVA